MKPQMDTDEHRSRRGKITVDGFFGRLSLVTALMTWLLIFFAIFHHQKYVDVPIRFQVDLGFVWLLTVVAFVSGLCGLLICIMMHVFRLRSSPSSAAHCLAAMLMAFGAAIFTSPMLVHSGVSASNSCINNLRLIDGAKQQWALEYHKPTNAAPTVEDLRPYLGRGTGIFPSCPLDGKYSLNALAVAPTCSITNHFIP